MNTSKGVIRCRDLAGVSDEEILRELKQHGVDAAKRIIVKKDGKTIETDTIVLTFNKPTLPTKIPVAYLMVKVDVYVPNPLRCFRCQQFGHIQSRCRQTAACGRCGAKDHIDKDCQNSPCCVNCGEDHTSFSKKCLVYQKEFAIQRIKVIEKVAYPAAKRTYEAQQAKNNVNYAKATTSGIATPKADATRVAIATKSVEVQTDVQWVTDKCIVKKSMDLKVIMATKKKTVQSKGTVTTGTQPVVQNNTDNNKPNTHKLNTPTPAHHSNTQHTIKSNKQQPHNKPTTAHTSQNKQLKTLKDKYSKCTGYLCPKHTFERYNIVVLIYRRLENSNILYECMKCHLCNGSIEMCTFVKQHTILP